MRVLPPVVCESDVQRVKKYVVVARVPAPALTVSCCVSALLLCCRCCSYCNIKQQAYKVETESRSFDDWCKRNNVSSTLLVALGTAALA
jgi:hypothetical protein